MHVHGRVRVFSRVLQRVVTRLNLYIDAGDGKNFVADAVIVPSMEIRRALKTRVRVDDFSDMTNAGRLDDGIEYARTNIQNHTRVSLDLLSAIFFFVNFIFISSVLIIRASRRTKR